MKASRALALLVALGLAGSPAGAAEWVVSAEDPETSLQLVLSRAAAGDLVRVLPGLYRGPLVVDRPLRIRGEGWPVIDGGSRGTVVAVRAPDVRFQGFEVRNSGLSLDEENAGITLDSAPRARIVGNHLEGVLFGVYVRRSPDSQVIGNRIEGEALPVPRRGDAIRVWYSDGTVIEDNQISQSRDVVLWYSGRLRVRGNRIRSGRYGLHFMYCDDASIEGNLLLDNSVGAFLMYSRRLHLQRNTIAGNHGPSGYGVGLKDMDDARVEHNLFLANRVGAFLDNSPREIDSVSEIAGNLFAANDVGILLLPNVRRATFEDNSLVENREQVALGGGGGEPSSNLWLRNHWSDYRGFDADADGFGDLPYRSDRLFESLTDRYPELRLLRFGPAAEALEMAARAFPVIRPQPKLEDPSPRMRPPALRPTPELPADQTGGWTPAAGGMVAAALLLLVLPRREGGGAAAKGSSGGGPSERRAADAAVVEARGLTKRYGEVMALEEVDFRIDAGESVALWGPNGAGKTTALRAMLGLIPFSGRLEVAGLDPRREGKRVRRSIGFVPQEIVLQGELTVEQTVSFFAGLRRVSPARARKLLERMDLRRHLLRRVGELSGGQRQRLAVGLALLEDPPILLLDEPSANLDVAARTSLYRLLLELVDEGKTLLFTSHRVEEVLFLAGRVLHLDAGRLVDQGKPESMALDGSARVDLQLRIGADRRAEARELLTAAGLECRPLGPYLLVTVPGDRKVAPLALLLERGFEVEDLGLAPRVSAEGRDA